MAAILFLIGVLLGTAAPVSLAAVTATQWVAISLMAAKGIPDAVKLERQLDVFIKSPAFAQWAAANGEMAIRLQPGITTFNHTAY